MLRKAAMVFGVVFVLIGVLGFIPAFTPNGVLLGIFDVDAVHNVIHIASGLAALAASSSARLSRLYFQVFAVVYGIVTVGGFLPFLHFGEEEKLLGLTHMNMADNLLHVAITAAAAYFGYVYKNDDAADSATV